MHTTQEYSSNPIKMHQPCPKCGSSDALTIYDDGHTYCFSCEALTNAQNTKVKRGSGDSMNTQLIQVEQNAYPCLSKRKLDEDTLRKFGYTTGISNGKTYHVAPYYSQEGNLVAQHLRGPNKEFKWRGSAENVQLFGQHLWATGGRRVVVTEGELDCMSVSQIQGNKWATVSIPSGTNSAVKAFKNNLEWLEAFDEVIICFDSDAPGQKAAKEAAQVLSAGKAKIAQLPLKDASDMLQAGRGKELMGCIWQAAAYRPDGIISGASLWEAVLKEPVKGVMTPFPELNDLTYGIRPNELWLFTAGSGIGKSTIVHEIGYKLMMEDHLKLGVLALEEPKEKTAKRYLSIYLNHPIFIDHEGISLGKLEEAFKATIGQEPEPGKCLFELYDHFGSTDIDILISKIRYMFVALDVDIVILDHISIVVSGLEGNEISEGERRTLDILMTKLHTLVTEVGKTIIAVAHLKRPDQGKSWNEGKEPRLTDLRGSASLEQLSDMVVALYRDQTDEENKNRAGILVLKNRPIGPVGKAGTVVYNQDTGRLLPYVDDGSSFGFEDEKKPKSKKKKKEKTEGVPWDFQVPEESAEDAEANF